MRAGEEAVRKSIDDSLSRLKTPYLDLLLIHWPVKDCVKFTWKIMESYQKTIPQIVLRWIVQRGLITIPRCKPNHFAENLAVMEFSLAEEDMQVINGLNQNHRSDPRNNPDDFPW